LKIAKCKMNKRNRLHDVLLYSVHRTILLKTDY
jgi:hypothetical protein